MSGAYSLTDDGNALQLVDEYRDRIRYCPDRGRWLAWDGRLWRWCPPNAGIIREHAKAVARALPYGEDGASAHRKKSLSANGISAMLTQAATDIRVLVDYNDLDNHPLELNTPAGAVDLATGSLLPPDPDKLHTKTTRVLADPTHPTPRWTQFLADTFAGREELVGFVQILAGYSATGSTPHHVLPFLHGPGGNGKSVFLDVLRSVLGDYAGAAPAKFLMSGQTQHETEVARLSGLRMVICSEINQEDRFDEAKVKLLTGGDALTARFMRQDHFTFTPTHHLWLMGNHMPQVRAGGESFWRRLRVVGFNNTVPEDKKVEDLAAIMVAEEGPGILAWVVAGARQCLSDGLHEPVSVMLDTSAYADEEDALARFVEDRCHLGGGKLVQVNTADLRTAYTKWCADEGEPVVSPQVLGRELRSRFGIDHTRSNGRRYYVGVTLVEDREPDGEEELWYQK